MATVITQKGQTLDDIVYQVYGVRPQMLDVLMNANPHLLDYDLHLPAGLAVNLPPIAETAENTHIINLWD